MEHPSPLPHITAHQVYYTVPHEPLWNTPPPFPTALHTGWSTRYPISLYGTPLPPSPQHCTPGGLHGTPPAFMEHPSPLPHSTAHQVYYTVPHQPLWNTPPTFPTALHTRCTTQYPTSLYGTPLPPSPQHCTPAVLHVTPPAFMKHPTPFPHSTAHQVYYTVPHQPLWNTPPTFPTALHTRCTTQYPTSLYRTPLPPSPQQCTPGVLHGTPPAFMEHPSPLPHSTAHQVYYTVPHQPLWNTPPPFPTALHTGWSTRYPTSLYGTPPPLPHSTAHQVYYTVPHQPLWNTPPPLPHSIAHRVYYTVPHQPLWNTPPPFPTALHTRWSTRYPTSLYATPLPPSPQHRTPDVLHGTPPAFMEHPSPLPHSIAHRVVYMVPHQPLWNTPPPLPHRTTHQVVYTVPHYPFWNTPSPLPHSTAHRVYYTVAHQPLWNTPPPFPTTLHTGWSTRYPTSLYGTPLPLFPTELHTTCTTRYPTSLYETHLPPSPRNYTPRVLHGTPPAFMEHPSPLPHNTAHRVYYTVPHQPLWNTPPPFPTALHTRCTTRYPTSLCGTPLPASPQHCTPGGLHGTPPAFMEHPSPLPHNTAYQVYYTVRHQPLWNTPPPFPTTLHTRCTTRYPTSLYGTPLPPSPQHCTAGGLHGTPPAFMEHPSPLPHKTAYQVVYTVPQQPLWNTPPPFPTALHTRCNTRYPTSLYGTPLPPSPQHCTPGGLHGTPAAFMEHPSPLPHSTAQRVVYTVPHQPLWNTPPPFPTTLHTRCTTRYPTSLYGTPLPPSPQHCTPGGLHGTPPAFMEHPSPLPHNTAHRVYYTVPHQPLWNTPPPFPTALHTRCTTRYPTSLCGTPLPASPQHCTPGGLHGTPPAFMEHPSPLPHNTAYQVYYTVRHQPLWNTPPPFPTTLHTRCTTRYPTSLYGTPLPPSPQHCTAGGLHGTPPAFMEHPSPLPHKTAYQVVYTVPQQPLWNTPPPFPTALHTRCNTRYPTSLYGTPLPPSPQHCTPRGLHGTPAAFMEHPSPLPHSTAQRVVYTVPHQPLWNTPPPFSTTLHTRCTTRYPTSLYGTPLPPSPRNYTPRVLHGTPPAFMEHPSPLPHNTAHRVYYTVPHQPLWNTPPPFPTALHTRCTTRYPTSLCGTPLPASPQHCTPGGLHGTPPAFMEHPSPLPHNTAYQVYYTVRHQPLWNTPPPFPTTLHTRCTTRYPTSLYGTPLPPSPQHCTAGGLHGTPPAFMEHPSPLPHKTAYQVVYTVPQQPLWNTPPPFPTALHTRCNTRYPTSLYGTPLPPSPQHCTPGGLHGTPAAFMEHPSPLPHSTAQRVVYTVPHQPLWNTPPPFPTTLHTRCTTRYPTSLYGTPLPPSPQHCTPGGLHGTAPAVMEHPSPLPHSTAHQVVYTVPHQPLWNTPPPFPTALHTRWSTWYPTSLYGTPLPPSPQHCTPGVLHGTPPAFMEHSSPLPHNSAHQVVYMVPHQPLWNTPPPFPTALHTRWSTRYRTSRYGTPLPPSPQHCTPGGLHGTAPAVMEHPSPLPHSTAHQVVYTVPHQPSWNTPPPFPTALHTGWSTRYRTSRYGTPLPPSPQHCTPGGLHGTPPAFMEHPSPLPHSTAHQVYYTVPQQPLWNTPPPFPTTVHTRWSTWYSSSLYGTPLPPSPQHCTPGGLHGTPPAFMEHPSPLPHNTAHQMYYMVPHQPLWNTPPPFPTTLHTRCTTWYPISLYGTPLPPSPQHCTPGGLHGTPPAFMQHPSPLPHNTAHQMYYMVPHQPLWNTPPPFPTALHTGCTTR